VFGGELAEKTVRLLSEKAHGLPPRLHIKAGFVGEGHIDECFLDNTSEVFVLADSTNSVPSEVWKCAREADFAVVNLDDPGFGVYEEHLDKNSVVTYSINDSAADIIAKNIRRMEGKTEFELLITGNIARVPIKGEGDDDVLAALGSAAVLIGLGWSLEDVVCALSAN